MLTVMYQLSGQKINGQTVLEEDYDENYQPTEEGLYVCIFVDSFAVSLHIDRFCILGDNDNQR